ncbi:MAG: A/G-specific adenine glycosylase [Parcubacteria group bacterium Gr01-1014_56]|nr:MAG: A/G-specific adenine glycosylase [Parcubacteria group bacterium Gr01-1014_56]
MLSNKNTPNRECFCYDATVPELLRSLKKFYAKNKRDLPWRTTYDPYKILVSEVMLQQTQAKRVVPFYLKFIKRFPTARALARARLSDVLKLWSGLGYNRRAKFLHEAAKKLSSAKTLRSGEIYRTPARKVFAELSAEFLESLPGVGPYTARAVAAFAYNRPEIFIETNIRTVFLYSNILQNTRLVSDKEILPLVEKVLKKSKMQPRDFYAALMDYGAFLKQSGVRINSKSKHYTKQKKFEGSTRQLRGAILKKLLDSPQTAHALAKGLSRTRGEVLKVLDQLKKEQLVKAKRGKYSV